MVVFLKSNEVYCITSSVTFQDIQRVVDKKTETSAEVVFLSTTTLRVILTVLFKNYTTIRGCINLWIQRVGGSIDLFIFGEIRETIYQISVDLKSKIS